jgi:hypothetical protein
VAVLNNFSIRDTLNVLVSLNLSHTEMRIITFGLELKRTAVASEFTLIDFGFVIFPHMTFIPLGPFSNAIRDLPLFFLQPNVLHYSLADFASVYIFKRLIVFLYLLVNGLFGFVLLFVQLRYFLFVLLFMLFKLLFVHALVQRHVVLLLLF